MSRLLLPNGWEIPCWGATTAPGPGCQPTVIEKFDGQADPVHRGACHGCDWIGPDRDDENAGAEDAHDHSHPGWRSLPVIPSYRYDDPKVMARLRRELRPLYPTDWAERCGPTITWRSPGGSRHVPGHGLFGGYCMGRVRAEASESTVCAVPATSAQLDLFG